MKKKYKIVATFELDDNLLKKKYIQTSLNRLKRWVKLSIDDSDFPNKECIETISSYPNKVKVKYIGDK